MSEKEHQEEIDIYIKKAQELKASLDNLQKDMTAKQTEVYECSNMSNYRAFYIYAYECWCQMCRN